jgi:selenocysteine-specific elongation factor
MKHIIIGTAGHIDHGKTTLIRAITGRNTDRLKEEQDRGISIELGFTYFDLPNGQRAGIIDVPGHEKFIKNMLAGVIGIDIVLFVVAADEGIMPQTIEHLAILDLLGTKKGVIVLTKTDLVDKEWIELVEEDIRNEVRGTFLEDSQIIRVSSTKKTGIDKLTALLNDYASTITERDINDMPRLPVDRVFTISGFGTVVTGTLLSGQFKVGDEVQIYPGNLTARIRSLQVHDEDEKVAFGGQRVAINLAGIKKEDIHRGSVVAPINAMKESMMIDVKVKLLKSAEKAIENRTRLHLDIGTDEVLCRIILLDKEELKPGEEAYAQLRLEETTVSKRGDKFILRFYSPMFTIGGGTVLEPNASKKKRFDKNILEELKIKESGSTVEILEKIIFEKRNEFLSLKDISIETSMLEANVIHDTEILVKENKILLFYTGKDIYPIHKDFCEQIKEALVLEIGKYHEKYPLRLGMPKEELRGRLLKNVNSKVADKLFQKYVEENVIEQTEELIKLKGFYPSYTKEQQRIKSYIMEQLLKDEFLPPKKEDIASSTKVDKLEVDEVFNALILNKEIIKINEEVYLNTQSFDKSLKLLNKFISEHDGISVGEYRDILGTNRKVAIGLLEFFDLLKITKRDGEKRTLIK